MKVVVLGLVILIIAALGYFIGPSFGMDGLSWSMGAIVTGVIVAAMSAGKGTATTSTARPSRAQPKTSTIQQGDGSRITLYVGNLAFKANRHALAKLFEQYGEVLSARVATDRNTRKPRGYGFVEMNPADAAQAMAALNGEVFFGRELTVTEAKEQRSVP